MPSAVVVSLILSTTPAPLLDQTSQFVLGTRERLMIAPERIVTPEFPSPLMQIHRSPP
jgi:hypothetical protein